MSAATLRGAEERRAKNRIEMRNAILEEASNIVADQGVEALSLRAIARNLGYSPGALYEYFRDKDAILHGLFFKGADGLGAQLERVVSAMPPGTNAVDGLRILAHAYREHALANLELFRLGMCTVMPLNAEEHEFDDRANQGGFPVLLEVIERGQAEGDLVETPAALLALSCWALVHGFVSLEASNSIAGGNTPTTTAETPEASMQNRTLAFDCALTAILHGISRR